MVAGIQLKKAKKELLINNLKISNKDVFDFLVDKKDLDSWIEKAIIIGCMGLKQMVLTDNVDFVEKEFNKFLEESKKSFEKQSEKVDKKIEDTFNLQKKNSPLYQFTSKLDNTFDFNSKDSPMSQLKDLIEEYFDDEDGKLVGMMQDYFDREDGEIKNLLDENFDLDNKKSAVSKLVKEIKENTDLEEETIKNMLDPSKVDSPIRNLKEGILDKFKEFKEEDLKEFGEKLEKIKEKILVEEAIEEEKRKGTQKGLDFEDYVFEEMESVVCPYGDEVKLVGGKKVAGSKTGDILVELNGNKQTSLIIECKDSSGYSAKKTKDEIFSAIKNRKAKFGIFLFKERDQVPSAFKPIKITDNYIITYMEKDNLHLSYKLARVLMIKEDSEEKEIDFTKVSKELNKIEDAVKNIDNMRAKVSNILNSGRYLEENLGDLQVKIDHSLTILQGLFDNQLSEDIQENDLEDESELNTKICPICGENFESASKNKKYCSYECRDRLSRLKNSKYLEPEDEELKKKLIESGEIGGK